MRLLCVTQLQLLLCRLRFGNKSACICAIIISALLPLSLRSIDFSLIHALFKRRELESSSTKKSVPLSFVRRIRVDGGGIGIGKCVKGLVISKENTRK